MQKNNPIVQFIPAGIDRNFMYMSKELLYNTWKDRIGSSISGFVVIRVEIDNEHDGIFLHLIKK